MRPLLLAAAVTLVFSAAAQAQQPAAPVMPVLPPPAMVAADAVASPLDAALVGDWRSEANKARDQYRHPRETLEFFGVKPTDAVIEIWPGGGGWYAELLAPMLRDAGSYTGVVVDPASAKDAGGKTYAERNNAKLRALFDTRPDVFGKARIHETASAAPALGAPGSADVVLTFRNVHNWVMDGNEKAMFAAFFAVLKPGGVLGVVDHRARPNQPAAEMQTSGYLPQAYVIGLATAAGFELAAASEINANPLDSADHDKGVWTLPPRLAKGDQDREKYLAIGESDRMTLRFVKPGK